MDNASSSVKGDPSSSPGWFSEEKQFRHTLRQAALPMAALIVAMGVLLGLLLHLFSAADKVDHSNQVLAQISRIEKLAVDMETGVRGYGLTGNAAFLPLPRASTVFSGELDALESLLRNDSLQLKEARSLRKAYSAWIGFVADVREGVQRNPPGDIAAPLEGSELMDSMQSHISAMQEQERRRLVQSSTTHGQLRTMAVGATLLSALIIAPLLALSVRRALQRATASYHGTPGALDRQREQRQNALPSVGDGVIVTDAEGRVSYMNSVAEELTGWKAAEATGQPLAAVFKIIDDQSHKPVERVERVLREGRSAQSGNHTLLIAKDGHETAIADSAAPIRDARGSVAGVMLTFHDQQAERQAAANMEWLASFPEKNPNPVVELDLETGEMVYANNFALTAFPDLKARGLAHELVSGVEEAAQPLFEGKAEFIRREVRTGESCYAQTICRLGEARRVRLYCTDITNARNIEAALRDSRDQVRLISDSVPALISYVDKERRYQFCNHAYVEWFGLPSEQILGRTMQELIGDAAWEMVGPHVDKAFTGQNVEYEVEAPYRTGTRWIHAIYRPHRDSDGKVIGIVILVMDITEEKLAEAARRESEEKFRKIFEHAATGIAISDGNAKLEQCNPAYYELLGYTGEELLGKEVMDLVHPDDRAQNVAKLRALQEQKIPFFEIENRYLRKNGEPVWVRKFVSVLRATNGAPAHFVALVTDMSERKRAELLLDSQKRSLEMIASGAPLAEVLTYLAEVVEGQFEGKAAASILLLDAEGLLRNGASPSLPEDYVKAIDGLKPDANIGTFSGAAAAGQVVITPDIDADPGWQTLKHLPMKLGFVAAWSQPITSSKGGVLGTFGTYFRERREPTPFERRMVEILSRTAALAIERQRVEIERKRFVSLAEDSSDFIGICDASFTPFFVNRAGMALVGLDNLEQARRIQVKDFFFPEDQERIMNDFLPIVLARGNNEIEVRFRHFKTGEAIWMLNNVRVLIDDQGKIGGFASVSRDITDRKRYEEALQRSQAELAIANKQLASRATQLDNLVEKRTAQLRETIQQLETFSYSIVHDLRAPLRSMRSFAGFVYEDYSEQLDAKGRDYLRRITESAARMDTLITDVLNYSRVSRGPADLTPVDLDRLVPEIIEQYPHFQEKAEFIHLERPLPRVAGNTALLTQVFSNLLENALKFIPKDQEPRVNVRAETRRGMVRIWVEDNGIGVPSDQSERIFGLFQRLHRSNQYAGTGVGLAIVKRAMERMGGKAGVQSESGKGSRFWIDLRPPGASTEEEATFDATPTDVSAIDPDI